MSGEQQAVIIALAVAATLLTRAIPFILFPEGRESPQTVLYLGRVLPAAVFGFLVVFCLKDVDFTSGVYGAPEMVSVAVTAALHAAFRNMMISIASGSVLYIVLVNFIMG